MGNNPVSGIDADGGWSDNDNIGVNKKGNVVFNDGIDDGNLFLVNDGVGKIKDLEMLKNNSVQLAKDHKWTGTDQQKIDYVKSQWLHAEGGFDWFPNTNEIMINHSDKSVNSFGVNAFLRDKLGIIRGATFSFDLFMRITSDGGKSSLYSNPYNTRNTISHEKRHLQQGVKYHHRSIEYPTKNYIELDAINYQRSVESWNKTTPTFKESIKMYENKFKN